MDVAAEVQVGVADALRAADLVVVGAGLFGLTIAERAATVRGARVAVLDRRERIGGNAVSEFDAASGIEVHKYGTHIFHTSNTRVWDYVNKFTGFNDYRHVVWTRHRDRVYPMPVSLATMSLYFGRCLTPQEARDMIQMQASAEPGDLSSFEGKAISLIGEPLYRAFFEGYTAKQWQSDPSDLPAEIVQRLPVRYNFNTDYFTDRWQGLPDRGYSQWFDRMVTSDRIRIFTSTDFMKLRSSVPVGTPVVYTGPIDAYFGYRFGPLQWRTLDFETECIAIDDFQGTSVMNYADIEVPWTRIHEYKHLHPERTHEHGMTIVSREFSRSAGRADEPYYPVNAAADRRILTDYRAAAAHEPGVLFGGRLGSYQYLDMHMAIASALTMFDSDVRDLLQRGPVNTDESSGV